MIDIVEYRPGWIAEFQQIAEALRQVLRESAMRIDHVGSTAVPLLFAKDIIDVQVTVATLEPGIAGTLLAAGYTTHPDVKQDHVPLGYEGPDGDWAKLFFMQPGGQRRVNIHVRQAGRPNQRYALLFRDFLRANRPTAMAYGELKRRLASSLANDDTYPDVKDPAVDLIHFAAEQWAAQTGWRFPAIPQAGNATDGEYEVCADKQRLDIATIHEYLAQSYWSPGVPRAVVERAIEGSLCFGVFFRGKQVGFARVVTDKATFAYLADVFILEPHRGKGLSKLLMQFVFAHPDLQGLRRFMLATKDAHGLYGQFGFTALSNPARFMELHRPDAYRAL